MKKLKNPIKMEDKDHLKEILGKIVEVNEPIDLEGVILKAIHFDNPSANCPFHSA